MGVMCARTIVGHIRKVMRNRYGRGRSNNRGYRALTAYICGMTSLNLNIAEVASLVGDPARTNILAALMDGRALTSTELAYIARVAPQTASGHLAKLTRANLLAVKSQGRPPLLSDQFRTGWANAGKHHGGRSRSGSASARSILAHRRADAQRSHLLRSPRR